jgi:hypothetical protein
MKSWLPNALGFQLVWLAAVGGAGRGWWWAGPLALAVFALWQLSVSTQARSDAVLMAAAAVLGFGIDTVWVQSGLMQFAAPEPFAAVAPVWIVALWMGFALTLNHSMAGLRQHLVFGAALGIVGGPLAYYVAAHAWHAVELASPHWIAYLALALAWGAVTPLLLAVARPRNAATRIVGAG